ncbi:hypothetical protein Tco_1051564, partial [Tanacetum coccineum]
MSTQIVSVAFLVSEALYFFYIDFSAIFPFLVCFFENPRVIPSCKLDQLKPLSDDSFAKLALVFKPKRSRGGRGVKEKEGLLADNNEHKEALGTNHDTSIPKVVNEVGKDDVMESFPPLSTPVTTTAGNAPGKSLYANITGKPSGKKVNVRTLFTPRGNGIDAVVLVDSIRAISERFANRTYGFFLG